MPITTNTFWMNPQTNSLLADYGSNTNSKVPIFNQGDIERLDLHLVQIASSGATYEVPFPAGCSIQVAVGLVNELPTAGTWRLQVSGTETADLDYNATAAQIGVVLNAISAVSTAGGVTVSTLGDSFLIAWNTSGAKPDIEAGSDTLTPASYESLQVGQVGDAFNKQTVILTLRQSPVAIGTTWTPIANPVTSISLIQAWNGTQVIYRLDTNPLAKTGSLLLTYNDEQAVPIDINSPSGNYSIALQELTGVGSGKVNVSQSGEQTFDIAIQIAPTTGLAVDYSGLIGFSGYFGDINFSTAEVHALLQGNDSIQCSVEVRIFTDSQPQTVLLAPCFVVSDMVSDGAIAPVSFGTPLTEEVANSRFIRRDINQAPDAPTQDIIWQNLGVTEDGSDVAAAISNANSPSGANPLATMADVGGGGGGAAWGGITGTLSSQTDLQSALDAKYDASNPSGFIDSSALSGYAPLASPSFTGGITADGGVTVPGPSGNLNLAYTGITFPDSTVQTTAYIPGTPPVLWNQFDTMEMLIEAPSSYISSGYSYIYASFMQGANPISHWYNGKYATAYFGIFINGALADVISFATTYNYGFSSATLSLTTGDSLQVKLGWYDGANYTWATTAYHLDTIY
jgi:hypothetical protein